MRKRTKARECALKILYKIDITKDECNDSMEDFWVSNKEVEPSVKAFANDLVKGVSENIDNIDKIISSYATNWNIKRMAIVDRNILRLSTCELIYMKDIPPKVSINEAVEIAKKYGDKDSSKFVNGILDKIKKEEVDDGKKG